MKNIVIGIGACVLACIVLLASFTLFGRNSRKGELENALTYAMEQTVESVAAGEQERPDSEEEFIALFLQLFYTRIESNSQVTVHILEADYEKGLLSVEAVSEYRHPLGQTGTVAVQRTAILELCDAAERTGFCDVIYLVEGQTYKKYHVQKGTGLPVPGAPVLEGKNFLGWRAADRADVLALTGKTVLEDCTYVAVFEEEHSWSGPAKAAIREGYYAVRAYDENTYVVLVPGEEAEYGCEILLEYLKERGMRAKDIGGCWISEENNFYLCEAKGPFETTEAGEETIRWRDDW